jgi:hypothetical protein
MGAITCVDYSQMYEIPSAKNLQSGRLDE